MTHGVASPGLPGRLALSGVPSRRKQLEIREPEEREGGAPPPPASPPQSLLTELTSRAPGVTGLCLCPLLLPLRASGGDPPAAACSPVPLSPVPCPLTLPAFVGSPLLQYHISSEPSERNSFSCWDPD